MKKTNTFGKLLATFISMLMVFSFSTVAFAANENVSVGTSYIEIDQENVLAIYDEYLAENPSTNTRAKSGEAIVDEFVQYAVDKGYIEDTPEQRGVITVAFLRAQFAIVAGACDLIGFDMTAECLSHSLNDSPSDLIYNDGSTFSNTIFAASECTSIINAAKERANNAGSGVVGYYYSGSTTLNSTTDLHLSLNKVSYSVHLSRENSSTNIWTVSITFRDTYDFEPQDWQNSMTDNAIVTIVNNYAAMAQEEGAIVPYDIEIEVETTFYT